MALRRALVLYERGASLMRKNKLGQRWKIVGKANKASLATPSMKNMDITTFARSQVRSVATE